MIRFENASFHYGGEHGSGEGVDEINLDVRDGEFVVLCGPSGCGKTTLARMINGLAPHFYPGEMEGRVLVEGVSIGEEPLSAISRFVGSVFQNPKSQFFNVDSTGELAFGCENQNMGRAEIHARLEMTKADMQLFALADRNIFELSGGEKQQIAVGSAYATQPQVYVLDEPSSNLDRKAIRRLRDVLGKIKQGGRTVVVSEHRLFYLMDLADRFVHLDDGRITGIYTAGELRALGEAGLEEKSLRLTDLAWLRKNSGAPVPPPGGMAALEAIDLSCSRGGNQILDIERLSIPQGSVVALVGDNGCGKSTLSEALCGVLPCSGSIGFLGRYLTGRERSRRSFLVMQDVNRQLFADSVMGEVRMLSDIPQARALAVLETLGIGDLADRHPASLSGGQKQRVAIACAVCAGKDVLFYDEPTSGLDRRGMESFGALLGWARGKAKTNVIATHDPELIMECCTHVLQMDNGRIQSFYPLDQEGAERLKAYFLAPGNENFSKRREKIGMLGSVFRYAENYRKTIFLAAVFMILGAAASIVPYLAAYALIDSVIAGAPLGALDAGISLAAIMACLVLHAVFHSHGLKLSHRAAFHILENLRRRLQEKMEKQPLGAVLDKGGGAIKKTFVEDIESIELLLAHMIPEGAADILVPLAALLAMVAIDWQLALLTALTVLLGVSVSGQMMSVGMEKMGDYFASGKRLNNAIIEYVNGMEAVRVFGRQGEHSEKYESTVRGYQGFALAWYRVCWPWMALYGGIFAHVTLYTLPLGALLVALGQLSLSKYVLVLCLSFGLGPLLMHCMGFAGAIPMVSHKIQAVEKAMDQPPLRVGEAPFTGAGHMLRFEDVRFSYRDSEVLKGVSFTANEGEMTALVGESGGGKSTVARLAVHCYDVASGEITLGGQPIAGMELDALNHEISYVSQDLFLFNKSLMENIRAGRPGATDEEVRLAARKAMCEDFIMEFENGYATLAGAAGARLSGGQRQRIAFARAILKDAPVLILDEAAAFVDPENEAKMRAAVKELAKGKTVVAIAHRLQSIRGAEKIIVLGEGRIIDEGRHEDLLSRCGAYKKLWEASEETAQWGLKGEGGDFA
ncbi:MAG: ATP-binding cassette domain-containing protein [Clostridiales bacterium]|jgi:energy-coupling factor transport system ATP-binding protein|nr:ATP-binding cassette domain-containing protein [Clostridiales bacterium]